MQREEILEHLKKVNSNHCILELPTSFGKTRLAIDIAMANQPNKIVIVIPRLVLIQTWKDEFKKWGYSKELHKLEFITYISFPKLKNTGDFIIFDEAHHLSARALEALSYMNVSKAIFLSATIKKDTKYILNKLFKNIYCYKVSLRQAIEDKKLPDPRVILIPLKLNNTEYKFTVTKNPKGTITKSCKYPNRWNYIKDKKAKVIISCTAEQYLQDLNGQIEFYKKAYMKSKNEALKNKWLYTAGVRLKFLSNSKNDLVYNLLQHLDKERTITFCNSIEQTELLGKFCINSKNKFASLYLHQFNEGKINHITACNMLNEGVNLVDCKIGIFANLNSSEIISIQRNGRLLRHKEPIIIIPYYVGTREDELVSKMLENYNKKLIEVITNIKELKI